MIESVYIAGPMTGIPYFNAPAFDAAATELRAKGYIVHNPVEEDRRVYGDAVLDSPTGSPNDAVGFGFDLAKTLAYDLSLIATSADAIAVLPGWESSKGATAETALAHALGRPVAPVESFRCGGVIDVSEVRTTSSTGGEKGVKPARYDLIPTEPLRLLAEHYGRGAAKYEDRNWERGYEWSKSFAAMQRHAWAFWGGENIDPETGSPHVVAVAWHAFVLTQFLGDERYSDFDDRAP